MPKLSPTCRICRISYISIHYLPEMVKNHFGDGSNWNVSIHYIHEEKPLGTGGALGLLPKNIPQLPMIMINGDILTKVNFFSSPLSGTILNLKSEYFLALQIEKVEMQVRKFLF